MSISYEFLLLFYSVVSVIQLPPEPFLLNAWMRAGLIQLIRSRAKKLPMPWRVELRQIKIVLFLLEVSNLPNNISNSVKAWRKRLSVFPASSKIIDEISSVTKVGPALYRFLCSTSFANKPSHRSRWFNWSWVMLQLMPWCGVVCCVQLLAVDMCWFCEWIFSAKVTPWMIQFPVNWFNFRWKLTTLAKLSCSSKLTWKAKQRDFVQMAHLNNI